MNIELLKRKRNELGLSQKELAEKCGLSKNTIYNYENGKSEPTSENLTILAKFFGIKEIDLLLDKSNFDISSNNFDITFKVLENNLCKKIEKTLAKKYKNISTKEIDFETTSEYILSTLKNITGKNIIYSNRIEKVIFFDNNSANVPLYNFEIIELYILNLISSIENLEKINQLSIEINSFINILNLEQIDHKLNIKKEELKETENKMFEMLENHLSTLKYINSLEKISSKEMDISKKCLEETTKLLNKLLTSEYVFIDKNIEKVFKKEYKEIETKYLKQLEEGGADE